MTRSTAEPNFEPPAPVHIDMREVPAGSVLDEFHFEMWAGFLRFMLEKDEIRAAFEAETGAKFHLPARNGLEAAIDKACGFDRSGGDYMAKFAPWVTERFWGGPEDICPAIAAKLSDV